MHTVLVVDDHIPTLTTLCMILNASGYMALGAQNAAEAEEKFRNNSVDMLLVDHGLPGISGSEVAIILKQIRYVKVVMLSGNPELKERPSAVDLLLSKPQQVPDLLAAIEVVFNSSSIKQKEQA